MVYLGLILNNFIHAVCYKYTQLSSVVTHTHKPATHLLCPYFRAWIFHCIKIWWKKTSLLPSKYRGHVHFDFQWNYKKKGRQLAAETNKIKHSNSLLAITPSYYIFNCELIYISNSLNKSRTNSRLLVLLQNCTYLLGWIWAWPLTADCPCNKLD